MLNLNIKKIHILTNIIILGIFSYIFYFSTKNIINLWTFSEIHINYSAGFVRRGLLGEILSILNNYGNFDKIFFSTLFYIFSITNTLLFLQIVKNITNNILIYIFFSFNPALILFSFYDLGGYARFEIFGIFILLLHTYIAQLLFTESISYKKYCNILIFIIYPIFYISILIHEINFFFLLIHVSITLSILHKHEQVILKNILILLFICASFLPIIYFILNITINEEKIITILNSLKYKNNVEIWILKSIATNFSERIQSEIAYMTSPWTNSAYYFLILVFFILPILYFLKNLSKNINKDLIIGLFIILPFFLLFIIGRDWGRWEHIIIMSVFCYFAQNKNSSEIKFENKKKFILILFLFLQLLLTRIPHCCNLVSKEIHLFGGLIPKIKILYEITFKNFDVRKRFKNF